MQYREGHADLEPRTSWEKLTEASPWTQTNWERIAEHFLAGPSREGEVLYACVLHVCPMQRRRDGLEEPRGPWATQRQNVWQRVSRRFVRWLEVT